MPTYAYRCRRDHDVELRRPIAERDTETICLECGGFMERQQAAPGFALQGAGFHANDYRKPMPKQFGEAD